MWTSLMVSVAQGRCTAAQQGFQTEAFDKFRIPGVTDLSSQCSTEDLTVEAGVQHVLRLVLRLCSRGLLIMGPPCSSFVMLNGKNCKRNLMISVAARAISPSKWGT